MRRRRVGEYVQDHGRPDRGRVFLGQTPDERLRAVEATDQICTRVHRGVWIWAGRASRIAAAGASGRLPRRRQPFRALRRPDRQNHPPPVESPAAMPPALAALPAAPASAGVENGKRIISYVVHNAQTPTWAQCPALSRAPLGRSERACGLVRGAVRGHSAEGIPTRIACRADEAGDAGARTEKRKSKRRKGERQCTVPEGRVPTRLESRARVHSESNNISYSNLAICPSHRLLLLSLYPCLRGPLTDYETPILLSLAFLSPSPISSSSSSSLFLLLLASPATVSRLPASPDGIYHDHSRRAQNGTRS